MKTLSILFLFLAFFCVETVNAAPAKSIIKLVKSVTKTTKKVPCKKNIRKIPARSASKLDYIPDQPQRGCIGCWWTGKTTCRKCEGKGVTPGRLWGTNKCTVCLGTGKVKHSCNR